MSMRVIQVAVAMWCALDVSVKLQAQYESVQCPKVTLNMNSVLNSPFPCGWCGV